MNTDKSAGVAVKKQKEKTIKMLVEQGGMSHFSGSGSKIFALPTSLYLHHILS